MRFPGIFLYFFCIMPVFAQQVRVTWHDHAHRHVKEVFQVIDTINNIRNGTYASYFLNGNTESRGAFKNNNTVGLWEFFYESGNIKMRGEMVNNTNAGHWVFFYENGKKSMEGVMNGPVREGHWVYYYENGAIKEEGVYLLGKRHGIWKTYYEDGILKSEGEFTEDYGLVTEYHHSGKIAGQGPRLGPRKTGRWRYYSETDGTLLSEGDYREGRKTGEWTTYYPSGKVASCGTYTEDEPNGVWIYYHPNGNVASSGSFVAGRKDGYWVSFDDSGHKTSEAHFTEGNGYYREYYSSGKLKVGGKITDNKREGEWLFYREDGTLEGRCVYTGNRGRYTGFYPNGALQTRGDMEGDKKMGSWEIFDATGKLTGYYRPYYDDPGLMNEIVKLSKSVQLTSTAARRGFGYFTERTNEFKGIILSGNPMFVFAGRLPASIEFYNQERLGHEFEFTGIRDPFFLADKNIVNDKPYKRGYSMVVRQKFYNPKKAGMWHFAHELRFTNLGHFVNEEIAPDNVVTFSASEQRIQYGLLTGYRFMQRNNRKGFSLDVFAGAAFGYRLFDASPQSRPYFEGINQSPLVVTFQGGFYFGHVFQAR